MKLSSQGLLNAILLSCCSAALFLSLGVNQLAQTTQKLPAPTGHVNDFAGVLNEQTRQQLENVLANLKLKTGIEFDVATVQSTAGQDISEFSLQLARDWNIGARTSLKKSLLMVLAVDEKLSFTRFSRSVQIDLPEGVLGEMGQRMRAFIDAGQFSEGLNAGVQHFVTSLSQKLAFNTDDFDKAPAVAAANSSPTDDQNASKPADQAVPVLTSASTDVLPTTLKTGATRKAGAATRNRKPAPTPVDDEAESEEVELTLTKPLEERVGLLKAFLDGHPDSKSRGRALEILVSARAGLGDQRLKKGDSAGGIEQLLLAIADAPVDASEKLFSGVIYQIPLNLYMRGEPAAATKAAQDIEAKFGNDPKRLVILSSFYVTTEQRNEALRLATQAVQLGPDLAEAHQGLGRALHISLRLDEAAAEYKRALELDPNSKAARRGLADLDRALGKPEDALALYRQHLEGDPTDKTARAGLILSLFDLGRKDEAKPELDKALAADPRNLTLLAGAAYWFAAHNESEVALDLALRAVEIEPRYTWSQIALARALVAQRKPLDAERALRFARQYGKFPTLDYELASTLMSAGLYDEAAEVLRQTFSIKDGEIETRLAGQSVVRGANFVDLLAPERRASIFQFKAADTENNAKLLKALLAFMTSIDPGASGETISEEGAVTAAKAFAAGDDDARVHRELFAASRLLQKGIGFQTAYELAEAARDSAAAGLTVPELTVVVQADEFRPIRARAIAAGGTPDIPEAPRNILSNLIRGRIEDTSGWALYNQDKLDAAVEHLQRAVTTLPEGTPAARTSLWHLGVALERQDKKAEALSYYIKSYNSGDPDPVRRVLIEQLYRKVNGSLDGLNERIGPGFETTASAPTPVPDKPSDTVQPTSSPESTPAATSEPSATQVSTPTPEPETVPSPSPSVEAPAATVPEPTPTQSPEATPSATPDATPEATPEATPGSSPEEPAATATPEPAPVATPESTPAPVVTPTLSTSPVEKLNKPPQTTVTITGRVKDASGNPLANVVVVLISPQGTVLASTTDDQGKYSFTVASSSAARSYRVIPSKDGLAFEPLDRVLPVVSDDVKELDFVGIPNSKP
ncbi:MAG: tetratricopeptide repeat protein [Pyrinomonadaceae bacterium]